MSRRLTKYTSSLKDNTCRSLSSCCHVAPFHQMSQRLFVVVITICYWKVVSGHCWMVSYHCHGRGCQRRPSPWWAITNRGSGGDDGGGGGKERRLCLFGNGCATNKQCMPNIVHMPNNQILVYSVPAHSVKHSGLNSGMRKFHWNDENSRPSCQSSFLQILEE